MSKLPDSLAAVTAPVELVELAEAKLHGRATDPVRYATVLAGLFDQPGGEEIDVIVNACTHFPLVEEELRAAAQARAIRFVDGGAGIARRIATLTEGQEWPDAAGDGVAVFTRLGEDERALADALAARGFGRIDAL